MDDDDELRKQAAKRTFARLRPHCTNLLATVTTRPDECSQALIALQAVVTNEPAPGLQPCLDYLLFPILLLLDAAVACRANKVAQKEYTRLHVGDKVAERAVVCLKTVLEKCPCEAVAQLTTLLRKLTGAAMLSPAEASEEFRHGTVLCLRSVFLALQPCKSSSCSCKYVLPSPFDMLKQDSGDPYEAYTYPAQEEYTADKELTTVDYVAPEVCPLGYLQSLDMAPAIGHLLSLLLQIADTEATLGGIGNGKLREDALSTLRVVLLKVGNADALAFFLPGVVSGLTKAIRSSMVTSTRSVLSATYKSVGAAGSTGALEESVRGLAEALVLVLADSRNWACLSEMDPGSSDSGPSIDQVETALENLQVLLKEDTKRAEESLKVNVHGDSKEKALRVGGSARDNKEVTKAGEPTQGLPLRLDRDRKWLESTTAHLESMLSVNLPLLCAHPSSAVRLAVEESAAVLLFSCGVTLERCTSLFLECLLALACDDWQHVASAASSSLVHLLSVDVALSSRENQGESMHRSRCIRRSKIQKQAILNLMQRLLERLPQAVFSGNDTLAVLHARRLAAALYFVGPEALCSSFLESLESCQRFVNIMLQCLSFSSAFAGPIDLSVLSTVPKSPALLAISVPTIGIEDEHLDTSQKQKEQKPEEVAPAHLLPRMPPWLSQNSQRVYKALASIIRLVGRAAGSGRPGDPALVRVVEALLEILQQAADELSQQKEQTYQSLDFGSGQPQRASAVSACVLNELACGASGIWTHAFVSPFGGRTSKEACGFEKWKFENEIEVKARMSECVGSILHDYLVPELWDLPVDSAAFSDRGSSMVDMAILHVLQDNAMLQQVLVEGIGVFGQSLGKTFEDEGYLGLVLYPLLEKLASTNSNVSYAADLALRTICYHCGYQSVKELVIKNADYVVDSLCRQLRHLELHPHAPSLLAAILGHTGAAPHLLPLLEEPMQGIVLELEIPARNRHPQYTMPLLRALREIVKAARVEGRAMLAEATRTADEVKATLAEDVDVHSEAGKTLIEQMISEIQNRERRRKSVASVGTSCLHACAPLLASQDSQTCLTVLGVIENGIAGLADMEATFPYLQVQRTAVEAFLKAATSEFDDPDAAEPFGAHDESSNRNNLLLPSMNQVWPQLVPCLRHTQPAVLVRVLEVMSSLITICGGQFFTRRIAKDALPLLLKLLREGPSLYTNRPSDALRPKSSKELLLLRNQGKEMQENGISPAAVLKVQQAVLKCIGVIAGDQKSASALESSYKPIVSWIVVLACKVQALRAAAAETLVALSNLDSDLVWLIVADLVYDGRSQGLPSPGDEFPTFVHVFPPLVSPKDALWVQYTSHNGDSSVDRKAADELLTKLVSSFKNPQ